MGLKMEGSSIHMPSVASTQANGDNESQKSIIDLISEKDKLESELGALSSVLDQHNVNMNTTLTTFDGYPRDDIDIAQIRTTRARIIHLRNDYKNVMSRIETALHAHHATAIAEANAVPNASAHRASNPAPASGVSIPGTQPVLPEAPFATVNSVINGSPADDAGLKAGDEVLRFGSANFMNHDKLKKVLEVVQQNQGRTITVRVSRRNTASNIENIDLQLTPRLNWGGRGLLGCHLLPL